MATDDAKRARARPVSPIVRMIPMMGLTWVVVGVFATALLHVMLGSPLDDQILDERGEKVMATPVGHRLGSSSNQGATQRHVIELRFENAQGDIVHTELETDHQDQFDAAEAGTPIEIEYDPRDPGLARWSGSRLNPLGFGVYWIGGIIIVAGIGMAIFGLFLRSSQRKA